MENITYFDDWYELLNALQQTYTMSISDVCELLKCSRNWVGNYIRPYVDAVYISSGIRDGQKVTTNWLKLAENFTGLSLNSNVYFNEKGLREYLKNNIVSCTKQTKSIPYTYFMSKDDAQKYSKRYDALNSEISEKLNLLLKKKTVTGNEVKKLYKELRDCHKDYIIDPDKFDYLLSFNLFLTKRPLTKAINVPFPDTPIEEWQAVHDLRGYGGTDEQIYRNLFKKGAIRLELNLPDKEGIIGKKIYYIDDPEYIKDPWNKERLLIPESLWRADKIFRK